MEDYVLGSADLRIREVEVTTKETNRMQGWPHFRSVGNVLIRFYDPRTGGDVTTRRGYEAITEERNGQIEVRDFTVKAQPYGS